MAGDVDHLLRGLLHVQDDRESVESIFLNIVQNMKLNHLETAALRLAIARDDVGIRTSLEDFRRTRSEAQLMESLHAIAQRTIQSTLNEAGYDGVDASSAPFAASSEVRADEDSESSDEDEDEDDESGSDDEDDEEEEDSGEAGSGNLMSTQAARERVFPLLISELSKESILTPDEARKLYRMFIEKNEVLNSALDVYDLDSNIAELVDTMLRLAKTAR